MVKASTKRPKRLTPELGTGRDATRERLLQTAYRAFQRNGYLNTTIKGICTSAGYTRGAFYSNFQSKEELFETIYFRANRRQTEQIQRAVHAAIDASQEKGSTESADLASIICTALRTLNFGTGDEVEWFGMVTELRGASVHDQASRKVLVKAQDNLYGQLESLVNYVQSQTCSILALPARDVVVLAVGLYERQLSSNPPLPDETNTVNAVDSLERLLRAITIDSDRNRKH